MYDRLIRSMAYSATIEPMNDEPQKLLLAQARRNVRMTQVDLEMKSGVDQSTISKIEQGKLNPTVTVLAKLANGMNLTIGDLFADREANEQYLINAYRHASPEQREMWLAWAKTLNAQSVD